VSYLILFLSVAVGAVVVLFWQPRDRRTIKLLTAFGGAYILAITAMHLLPVVFGSNGGGGINPAVSKTHLMGIWLLAGFFVQLILDYLSQGIEHGHAHHHAHDGRVPWGMLIGLCIHAYLEGTPLAHGDHAGHDHAGHDHAADGGVHGALLMGIVMHNVPVSIVFMSLLLHNGLSRIKALAVMGVFAVMSPLGMLTAELAKTLAGFQRELLAVVIGIFLHIATTILFEAGEEHRFNIQKFLAIVAGVGIAVTTSLFHAH
jgi:zinc and cadmium transporter